LDTNPFRNDALPAAFERVVAAHSSKIAVGSDVWTATYAELNATANRLAHALIERGCAPGDRVAILMQHDTPLIAAALSVLKAGGTVVVLNRTDPLAHLAQVTELAGARLMVADAAHRETAAAIVGNGPSLVDFESHAWDGPAHNPDLAISSSAIAQLVFTSGSTGRPKAVMQTHWQTVSLWDGYTPAMGMTHRDRVTLLAALSGGQGVAMLWTALLNGASLHPFPIHDKGVAGLASWMADQAITVLSCSASLFRHLTMTLTATSRFPHVRLVRVASETATAEDFKSYKAHFSDECAFVHTLSSSEVGLMASLRLTRRDSVADGPLPAGRPAHGVEIMLVDEADRPVAPGAIGEILVKSDHLSVGYWGNPELTSQRYSQNGQLYRTGDLARLNPDATIQFLGRKDARVKVRGNSVEPSEVEAAIAKVEGVGRAVVCVAEDAAKQPQLVAYVNPTGGRPLTAQSLRRAARLALPGFMVPSAFVLVDEFPLTTHGKVDRRALLRVYPASRAAQSDQQPETETERLVANVWQDALDLTGIGRDDDFFDLGGDSLTAAVVAAWLRELTGIDLQISMFFENPTLADFAWMIDATRAAGVQDSSEPAPHVSRNGPVPLSYNQEPYWQDSATPDRAAKHTMSRATRIVGPLDRDALAHCIDALVQRHEMLRTSFSVVDCAPVQIVHPPQPVPLPLHDLAGDPDATRKAEELWKSEAAHIFDVAKPPLVRFALVRLGEHEHWLLNTHHHIVADGWSWSIFFRELSRLYEARVARRDDPLFDSSPRQYGDYAAWQRKTMHPDRSLYRSALDWWIDQVLAASFPAHAGYRKALLKCMSLVPSTLAPAKKLLGVLLRTLYRVPLPPRGELPFKRPTAIPGLDPAEGTIVFGLDAATSQKLNRLGREASATYFTVRLAAYVALLADEIRDPNVVVYTAFSNRGRSATNGVFGFCASPTIVMFRCERTQTFRQLLSAVRDRLQAMQAHIDLPFDHVHRELRAWKVKPPQGRTILSMTWMHSDIHCAGVEMTCFPERSTQFMPVGFDMKFDMMHEASECRVLFDAGLYDPAGVRRFLARFIRLLDVVAREPDTPIGEALTQSLAAEPWSQDLHGLRQDSREDSRQDSRQGSRQADAA
jgi:amino acid adenylation domain-containing protein